MWKILRTITEATYDQNKTVWRRANKELRAETGQSIYLDMRAKKLRWAGHVDWSNPFGNPLHNNQSLNCRQNYKGGQKPDG